jgi:DNA-binding NarL/FixJ family response regulator
MRILLVDDYEEVRQLLRVSIGLYPDFEVVGEAATTAAAVEVAGRLEPDVVLLDLLMPDADPHDVFDRVRAAAPSSRIVIFSARETGHEWFEARGADFFGKMSDNVVALVEWLRGENALTS